MTLRSSAIYHAKQAMTLSRLNGLSNPALSRFETENGTRWRFDYQAHDGARYVVILKSASDYREHGGAVDATMTKEANAAPAPAPVAEEGVEIGETGPDWEPTAATRYYAQRGENGPFEFGPTPEAALAALNAKAPAPVAPVAPVARVAAPVARVVGLVPMVALSAFLSREIERADWAADVIDSADWMADDSASLF